MAPSSAGGCLVLMCGHPASGKTSAVADLRARLEAKGRRVVVVDEPGLRLRRDDAYADARAEKNTRGLLKATVERALYRDGPVVVLDAGNGIKGYRYELWCLARQAQTRFCVVHCDTPPEEARERNDARRRSRGEDSPAAAADAFSKAIFDDLVFRFEPPTEKNRWDAPLFVLRPPLSVPSLSASSSRDDERAYVDGTRDETLAVAVAMIVGETSTSSSGASAAAGPANHRPLTQNAATRPSTLLSDVNLRAEIDAGAQTIVDDIVRQNGQNAAATAGAAVYAFGEDGRTPPLRCRRPLTLAELRKLKREFVRVTGNGFARGETTREVVKRLFVEYLARYGERR